MWSSCKPGPWRRLLSIVAVAWFVSGCYKTTADAVVTVRDPTLVRARPYRPEPGRGFIPEGRGPAAMRPVAGNVTTLWLLRSRDGGIYSAGESPNFLQLLGLRGQELTHQDDILTARGELRLGAAYLHSVESTPKPERPLKPFFREFEMLELADVEQEERVTLDRDGKKLVETKTNYLFDVYRDVVIFETPPSNVVAVSKRTQPNRSIGVGHLAAGLFLDAAALWLAMKANEFPEGSRGDVYTISGGMVVASVPLLALGTYMLTKPAQTARLW
jgi:hypothetical protein